MPARAQVGIAEQRTHGFRDRGRRRGIADSCGIATDFRCAAGGTDHRTAACHGLQRRQAEAFVERREDQRFGRAIQRPAGASSRHIAEPVYAIACHLRDSAAAGRTGDHELEAVFLRPAAAQMPPVVPARFLRGVQVRRQNSRNFCGKCRRARTASRCASVGGCTKRAGTPGGITRIFAGRRGKTAPAVCGARDPSRPQSRRRGGSRRDCSRR